MFIGNAIHTNLICGSIFITTGGSGDRLTPVNPELTWWTAVEESQISRVITRFAFLGVVVKIGTVCQFNFTFSSVLVEILAVLATDLHLKIEACFAI